MKCETCENDFETLMVTETGGRAMRLCADCNKTELLFFYKRSFEAAKDSLDAMKVELNLFRTLMLSGESMEAKANDATEVPVRLMIAQNRSSWDTLSLDTVLYWLNVFEAHAREFSSLASRKASKEEIKQSLQERTSQEVKRQVKVQVDEHKKQNQGLTGTYTVDEKKAILGIMKALKVSEKVASEMIKPTMKAKAEVKANS